MVPPTGFCADVREIKGSQTQHLWWLAKDGSAPPLPTYRPPACPNQVAAPHSPLVLDVLVNHACNEHGDQGIVPGGDKHQGQAEAHAQEGQRPGPESGEEWESEKDQYGPRPSSPAPQFLTNSNYSPGNSNVILNGAPGFPNSSYVRGFGLGVQWMLTSDST